ncbi:MAG: chemotaxis protein CheW [Gammaproteobacteria bacterium]|jgi:chemosensory pili system protein ChpC
MSMVTDQVRSLLVPLRDVNMLLPNIVVAEVSNYQLPGKQPDMPEWILGNIEWRGQTIPVISLEILCGPKGPASLAQSRLLIINSVRPDSPLRFYAIMAAGLPRLIQFDDTLAGSIEESSIPELLCRVYIDRQCVVIPDLDYLQGLLEQHWAAAA